MNTLNKINEIVYNKNQNQLNTQNNEKSDTLEVTNKLTKNKKTSQGINSNLFFYIIILLATTMIVYIIIKKIVNKNRAK